MTLIAIHATPERLQVMTDTRSSDSIGRFEYLHGKISVLPHLEAITAVQGSGWFGHLAQFGIQQISGRVTDFDELVALAPSELRGQWLGAEEDREGENQETGAAAKLPDSVVFLGGYSPAAGGYVAMQFTSVDGFDPRPVEGLVVQPCPFDLRPTELEARRLAARAEEREIDLPNLKAPGINPDAPTDALGWVELAQRTYRDRAQADILSGLKWPFGRDVYLTTMTRGSYAIDRIHTFPNEGPEFLKMVAGTLHPLGQAADCVCGSGRSLIDCCVNLDGRPCPCHSGETFDRCCSIDSKQLLPFDRSVVAPGDSSGILS